MSGIGPESPQTRPERSTKRWRWAWAMLGATFFVVFVLDQALKLGWAYGYAPRNAAWRVTTADFPRAWAQWEGSGPYASLTGQIPRPMQGMERTVYEHTGVRPTPNRWAVWMGRPLTAGGNQDGWGVSTRPGLLLRAAHWGRRLIGATPDADGVFAHGDFYYGWRGGHVIISRSQAYVAACLRPQDAAATESPPSQGMRWEWQPPSARMLVVELNPAESMRISVEVEGDFAESPPAPRVPAMAWPEPMWLSVSAAEPAHLSELWGALAEWMDDQPGTAPLAAATRDLWSRWALLPLSAGWDADIHSVAVALDLAFRGSIVPEATLLGAFEALPGAGGRHPLGDWHETLEPIAFEWADTEGACAPLLGADLSLCLARAGDSWLAASSEPWMARLSTGARPATQTDGGMLLEVDWGRTATLLRQGLLLAARYEWIPDHDMATITENWGGVLNALAELGAARLTGHVENGRLVLEGPLTRAGAPS